MYQGAPKVSRSPLKKLPNGRIVGGKDANIEDYPHQISLLWYGSHTCGGSVVDATHVVTAGHCTEGSSPSSLQVRVGSSLLEEGGTVVNVKAIHQNPKFDYSTIDYDVSVLELSEPLKFGPTVATIGLGDAELSAGTKVKITGWGTTTEGGSLPKQLQVVEVPIVSRKACQSAYGGNQVTDRMICAGVEKGGKDSCQGDSGGPLIVDGKQYGIVSWGYGCGEAGYPGVYSNVVALLDYIVSVIGKN